MYKGSSLFLSSAKDSPPSYKPKSLLILSFDLLMAYDLSLPPEHQRGYKWSKRLKTSNAQSEEVKRELEASMSPTENHKERQHTPGLVFIHRG